MNKFKLIIPLAVTIVWLNGCAQRLTMEEYREKCEETYKPMNTLTGQVFYCGSKDGFDYVLFDPWPGMEDEARIKTGQLSVVEFPYTMERDKWVVVYPEFIRNQSANNVTFPVK